MIKVYNGQNPTAALRSAYIVPPVSIDHAVKICEVPANDANGVDNVGFYFDNDVTQGDYKTYIDNTMTALNGI